MYMYSAVYKCMKMGENRRGQENKEKDMNIDVKGAWDL